MNDDEYEEIIDPSDDSHDTNDDTTVPLQSPTATTWRTTRSTSRAPQAADLITTDPTQTAIISSAEVTTQKAAHDEAVKRYYDCQAVEQAWRIKLSKQSNRNITTLWETLIQMWLMNQIQKFLRSYKKPTDKSRKKN